jgi:hypothetical protein
VSAPDERTDHWLRRNLAGHRPPELDPALGARVLRRLAEAEREQDARRRAGARAVLATYWLAAALATLWLVARLPWPAWAAPVAQGLAVAAVPAGFAAALWPGHVREWLLLCVRPLLPPGER